jgi:carbon monoxide dehydrogenase subunit G
MPGASFESVEGDAFTGNVKIKLGLITCLIAARLARSPAMPT